VSLARDQPGWGDVVCDADGPRAFARLIFEVVRSRQTPKRRRTPFVSNAVRPERRSFSRTLFVSNASGDGADRVGPGLRA
jgi:hypothetical protein